MNSFNQYGSGNQQIGTQNNYYGQKNSFITIFIDIDLLEAWYKNNSVDVSPIMKSIKSAKMSYLKDNKTIIKVETKRLISLQDTHEDLIDADIIFDTTQEKYQCERIEILIKLINLNILDIEKEFIILSILHRIYDIHTYSDLMYCDNVYRNEQQRVKNLIYEIYDKELEIEQHIENTWSEWKKSNCYSDGYTANAEEEIQKIKANFRKYQYNFSPEINSINSSIQFKINILKSTFSSLYQWLNIPFHCKITFNNKKEYQFTMFNTYLEKCGHPQNDMNCYLKYRKLLSDNSYLKINLYTTLILRYSFIDKKNITDDDFDMFYTWDIKEITIEYDKEQEELRRIAQTYLSPAMFNEIIKPRAPWLKDWLENMFFYYN